MKELVTKKIYYKKFDHRLVVKCRRGKDANAPTPEIIKWLVGRKFNRQEWRGAESSSFTWEKGFWKPTENCFTVFFKDPAIMDYLKEIIGEDYLLEYEKPLDAQHSEMLEKEKVITRQKLFYDKYRYAIRSKIKVKAGSYKSAHITEMKLWCETYFKDREEDYRVNNEWNASFFFVHARDATMFRLANHDIDSVERIVLVSELEEARGEPTK